MNDRDYIAPKRITQWNNPNYKKPIDASEASCTEYILTFDKASSTITPRKDVFKLIKGWNVYMVTLNIATVSGMISTADVNVKGNKTSFAVEGVGLLPLDSLTVRVCNDIVHSIRESSSKLVDDAKKPLGTPRKYNIRTVVNVEKLFSLMKINFNWKGSIPVSSRTLILNDHHPSNYTDPIKDDAKDIHEFTAALDKHNPQSERTLIELLVESKRTQSYENEDEYKNDHNVVIVNYLTSNKVNKQITIPSEKYGWIDYIIDPITEGGAAPKPSKEKVTLPGKSKPTIVYLGTRGGKYVKVNGKFVSLKKFK